MNKTGENLRSYGDPPYEIAVLHGGPGAPGEVAPVARELSPDRSVLEPFQTADSIDGQVRELQQILTKTGSPPITLIGFSWGAWLGFILAAKNNKLFDKLILVGSAPFEKDYAKDILETRLNRLSIQDNEEVTSLFQELNDSAPATPETFARIGKIFRKVDSYDPILEEEDEVIEYQPGIYRKVWAKAEELRETGRLLELGREIDLPVVAIHGSYDPHPFRGVKDPLESVLPDFQFELLYQCGHIPWIERRAKDHFFSLLRSHLP